MDNDGCGWTIAFIGIAVVIAFALFAKYCKEEVKKDPPAMIQQYEHTYTHNPDSCDYCKYHPKK